MRSDVAVPVRHQEVKVQRYVRRITWTVGVALALALVWTTRVGTRWPSVYFMTGPSMEPTIAAERYFIAWDPPGRLARGDLVIFRFVGDDSVYHVLRRLVGLPGDTVSMRAGELTVNGARQQWPFRILEPLAWRSPFARDTNLYTWGPRVVGPDSFMILADTRDMIGWPDSRFVGEVPRDAIIARATRTILGGRLR